MALYAACDLHSNNTVLAVIDASGAQRYRHRLPNDLSVIDAALAPFREELVGVAVESTYNAYWLIDGLQVMGYPAKMVNTLAVPQYAGLKHGDDNSDATHLAELMRLGLLPTAYIDPREQRPLRDLLRRRVLLVQQSVRLLQSVQGYWARTTGQRRHRQPQMRQSLPGLGMDGSSQLRHPLRSGHQALVPAPQGEETTSGRAQGRRTHAGASWLSPVARWRHVCRRPRLCLRFAIVSPEKGTAKNHSSEWAAIANHRSPPPVVRASKGWSLRPRL
jgi:hypothetical protein